MPYAACMLKSPSDRSNTARLRIQNALHNHNPMLRCRPITRTFFDGASDNKQHHLSRSIPRVPFGQWTASRKDVTSIFRSSLALRIVPLFHIVSPPDPTCASYTILTRPTPSTPSTPLPHPSRPVHREACGDRLHLQLRALRQAAR